LRVEGEAALNRREGTDSIARPNSVSSLERRGNSNGEPGLRLLPCLLLSSFPSRAVEVDAVGGSSGGAEECRRGGVQARGDFAKAGVREEEDVPVP